MKKIIYFLLLFSFIGCSNKNDDKIRISQHNLDDMGLSKPVSLREISDRLTDKDKKKTTSISIYNGENIKSLDGIELFPILESLNIFDSKIKNLNDIQRKNLFIRSLFVESNEMEDVSNIVFLENLLILSLSNSEKLKSFPDIIHLKKLKSFDLYKCNGINFDKLAENLPLGIQMIGLNSCDIKSLNDIKKLFKLNIKKFDLQGNLIREIDFDMDYGAAEYIYMAGCPIGDKYIKWNDLDSEENPGYVINVKGVLFDFGPFQDEAWVIEE